MYLMGRPYTVGTDQWSWEGVDWMRDNKSRLPRWSLALQPYKPPARYRSSKYSSHVDALSLNKREECEGLDPVRVWVWGAWPVVFVVTFIGCLYYVTWSCMCILSCLVVIITGCSPTLFMCLIRFCKGLFLWFCGWSLVPWMCIRQLALFVSFLFVLFVRGLLLEDGVYDI